MPHRLKFFALFSVFALFSLGFAAEHPAGTEEKSVQFDVDGQIRYRYEYWQQHPFLWSGIAFPDFGFGGSDVFNHNYTNWQLLRSRLGVKASLSEDKFAYMQFQDSRYFGSHAIYEAPDMTSDLHNYFNSVRLTQAYFQVNKLWDSPFGLKIGRQFLQYGDEKLVGADDWSNYGQSFDAVKLMFRHEYFDGDLFYSQLWPYYPIDDIYANVNFFGFHGTAKYTDNHEWSAYLFGYRDGNLEEFFPGFLMVDPNEDPFPVTDTNKTMLWTLGTRAEGEFPFGLGYAGEVALQFGNWYQTDVSALMFELDAWYKFKDLSSQPYFGAGFTYASGDDSADGDKNTFVRLFPSPHPHLGYMDLVGMQNIMSLDVKAGVTPVERFSLNAAFHLFWLNEKRDAWYGAYGSRFEVDGDAGIMGRDSIWTSKSLGNELDFGLKYKYDGGLWFKAGWSHFFAGSALEGLVIEDNTPLPSVTADLEDADWIYIQTGLDF